MIALQVLERLVDEGHLERARADKAVAQASGEGEPLGRWILGNGWVSRDLWSEVSARALRLPFEPAPTQRPEVVERWRGDFFARHRSLPLRIESGALIVAVSDPTDTENLEAIEAFVRMPVRAIAAPDSALATPRLQASSAAETRTLALEEAPTEAHLRQLHELVRLALDRNATDVHLEPDAGGLSARLRVDGLLDAISWRVAAPGALALVNRIKVLAAVDVTEARVPQDGSFAVSSAERRVDVRASFVPTRFGTAVVLRVLDRERLARAGARLSLEALGIQQSEREALVSAARRPHGMILVSGPTGSGKTTTLYALLAEVDDPTRKLVSVEDPIEYRLPNATQIEVTERAGVTFATGLRSILRHDPDRILVGEIRDAETAAIAVQAALTGHLVLTTVHAATAAGVDARLQSLGLNAAALDTTLSALVAQRLVRQLCPRCHGDRCDGCGRTGFRGRLALAEVSVRTGNGTLAAVRPIREVCSALLQKSLTTREEIIRVWPEAVE